MIEKRRKINIVQIHHKANRIVDQAVRSLMIRKEKIKIKRLKKRGERKSRFHQNQR